MRRFGTLLISFALVQFVASAGFAQDKKPPVSSQPETTTATYGAWTLQCERRADVAKGEKILRSRNRSFRKSAKPDRSHRHRSPDGDGVAEVALAALRAHHRIWCGSC